MKTILYMAMTVNGYVARGDHSVAWSSAEWQEYARVVKDAGAYVIGNTTYKMMAAEKEFSKIGDPATCVLTHSPRADEGAVMFAITPEEALSKLTARGFTKVIIGGGAQCNRAFLKAGLVDEIIVDVAPVLFGTGIPLFSECALEVPLELIETRSFAPNEIQLRYRVIQESI